MNEFQPEMLAQQQHLADAVYLRQHVGMDGIAMVHAPNFTPSTSSGQLPLNAPMTPCYDESDSLDPRRSVSFSSQSTHSQSPPLLPHVSMAEMPYMRAFTSPYPHVVEQTFSVTAESVSKRDSDDETVRAERRRAQNRAAQRAYRQRKDQSLKQREREIESLREELDKAQRLNKTLCKLVAVLRERIKNPPPPTDQDSS